MENKLVIRYTSARTEMLKITGLGQWKMFETVCFAIQEHGDHSFDWVSLEKSLGKEKYDRFTVLFREFADCEKNSISEYIVYDAPEIRYVEGEYIVLENYISSEPRTISEEEVKTRTLTLEKFNYHRKNKLSII